MAQLSFKKLSSIPTSGMTAGTIMFNSTTHSIFVATSATDAEEYGGRLEDVTYSEGILTITKFPETAGGSKEVIKLDFSDTASASDVTRVLKGLYSRVTAVEEDLNGSSTVPKGLKKRVEDLENAMNTGDGDATLVTRMAAAEKDIDALQTTVGDTNSGLVQKVNQNATAIAGKAEKAGNSSQVFNVADPGTNTTAATPKSYVDNAISTAISTVYKIKGCIADKAALAAIKSPSNGDVYNVVAEVIVSSDDVGSGAGKFGAAGTYSAGTNWVWIQHTASTSQTGSETTSTGHWDALGGMITGYATSKDVTDLTERVGKLESGENTVKTFGGQSGIINVKTAETTDVNGTVQFTVATSSTSNNVNTSKLTATVKGLAGAAYKNVSETNASATNPIGDTNYKNNNYIPTNSAVAAAITAEHAAITDEMKENTTMTWAEWPV